MRDQILDRLYGTEYLPITARLQLFIKVFIAVFRLVTTIRVAFSWFLVVTIRVASWFLVITIRVASWFLVITIRVASWFLVITIRIASWLLVITIRIPSWLLVIAIRIPSWFLVITIRVASWFWPDNELRFVDSIMTQVNSLLIASGICLDGMVLGVTAGDQLVIMKRRRVQIRINSYLSPFLLAARFIRFVIFDIAKKFTHHRVS